MKKIGLWCGVFVFAAFFALSLNYPTHSELLAQGMDPKNPQLSAEMLRVIAITLLVAFYWIAEVLPIPATSIIPLALFPLLGILTSKEVAPAYGDNMILLLMGGFFIATVIEKVNLHKRIALNIIYYIGTNSHQLLLGIMVATAFLSMWISNTATTLMMMPIVLAMVKELEVKYQHSGMAAAFMLGLAYSASVGGVGTPIGTPPNLIMLGQYNSLREKVPGLEEITFAQWMMLGIPCVVIMIFAMWFYLAFVKFKLPKVDDPGSKEKVENEIRGLGRMNKEERITMVLFIITSLLWIFRQNINLGFIVIPGWSNLLGIEKYVKDTTVAIFMALVMFSYPVEGERKLLDWKTARNIPWGMLLLFGGGIAIAKAFVSTGLSLWLGNQLAILKSFPMIVILLSVCAMMVFLTEVTSNTAVTTVMMPILAITAGTIGVHPGILMAPAAIAASFAFMLPVATAPNAIAYSSETFSIATMAKTGFWINIVGIGVIAGIFYFFGGVAFPVK